MDTPLSILHITGRADIGGGPAHVYDLVGGLARLGHRNLIACPRRGPWRTRFRELVGDEALLTIPHRIFDPVALGGLADAVRGQQIAVVHSHGMAAGIYGRLLALLTSAANVHSFHGVPTTPTLKHRTYRHLIEPVLAPLTRLAIAVSAGEARLVRERYPAYGDRIAVVPNAIAVTDQPPEGRPPGRRLQLVSFSRPNQQKHPELMLAIACCCQSAGLAFEWHAYGDGLETLPWATEAARAGLHLHGATRDPVAALRAADLYLSTSRWEGLPLALLEAAAHGAVVVATDVPGNRDAVRHNDTGLLYPDGDYRAAAGCLAALAADPGRVAHLRTAAWAWIRDHHAVGDMAAAIAAIYRQALAAGAP